MYLHRRVPVLDIEGIPVDRFFDQEGIVIDSIENDDQLRLAVVFHGNVQTPTGPDRVVGGTIWFWPEKSWGVAEYDVHLVSGEDPTVSQAHRTIEWDEVSGVPVPISVIDRYSSDPEYGFPKSENRWQFSHWAKVRHENERFLLSHYGFPEPGLAMNASGQPLPSSAHGNRWLLWLNLAAVFFIAVGITLRYRSQQ